MIGQLSDFYLLKMAAYPGLMHLDDTCYLCKSFSKHLAYRRQSDHLVLTLSEAGFEPA